MIEITIRRITTESYKETKNFIVSKTPTEIRGRESEYDSRERTLYSETYETREVDLTRTNDVTLLKQNIEDDSQFNLAAVIKALNGIA